MKKIPTIILAALAVLPALVRADNAPALGGLRYTIAVTKFENRANYSGQFALSDTWSALLTEALARSGHFIVIAEADMRNAAMAEQDFANSGRAAKGDKAPVTGNMTPAQLLVKGEITHFEDGTKGGGGGIGFGGVSLGVRTSTAEINAMIYVVDSTTGQVVAQKKVVAEAKSSGMAVGFTNRDWSGNMEGFKKTNVGKAVEDAIDQAVAFCSAQLSSLHWSGNVILVKGAQVYINRGQREGVPEGAVFKVGTSEALRDPGTGELLDMSFTEKGQIRVDTVKEKMSICSILSGSGIETGMSVVPP